MNTQEIEKYLEKKLSQNIAQPGKFPQTVKEYLIEYLISTKSNNTDITKEEDFIRLSFFMLKNKMIKIDKCGYDGCTKFKIFSKSADGWNLRNGCCGEHALKNTMLKNHNCINPMHSDDIKEKLRSSIVEKYGVEHNSQSEIIKERKKETNLTKLGVENPQQNKEISKKSAETRLEKYGFSYPLQNPENREKAKKTNIKRYGCENPMHNPEIAEKAQRFQSTNKEYIWKTGETVMVQGYENIVLYELEENGYSFKDIKTNKSDMPEIWYEFEGKRRRYYPDIFIPNENLIIEVKSTFTLEVDWARNQAKFDATKNLGFNFKLEVR